MTNGVESEDDMLAAVQAAIRGKQARSQYVLPQAAAVLNGRGQELGGAANLGGDGIAEDGEMGSGQSWIQGDGIRGGDTHQGGGDGEPLEGELEPASVLVDGAGGGGIARDELLGDVMSSVEALTRAMAEAGEETAMVQCRMRGLKEEMVRARREEAEGAAGLVGRKAGIIAGSVGLVRSLRMTRPGSARSEESRPTDLSVQPPVGASPALRTSRLRVARACIDARAAEGSPHR